MFTLNEKSIKQCVGKSLPKLRWKVRYCKL